MTMMPMHEGPEQTNAAQARLTSLLDDSSRSEQSGSRVPVSVTGAEGGGDLGSRVVGATSSAEDRPLSGTEMQGGPISDEEAGS